MQDMGSIAPKVTQPLWLLAEITYRCPLQCPYCSNPTDFAQIKNELSTEEWIRVFKEARAMGAVQLGFSGGEPLVRQDLEADQSVGHRNGHQGRGLEAAQRSGGLVESVSTGREGSES